jgi:hypothetical protein
VTVASISPSIIEMTAGGSAFLSRTAVLVFTGSGKPVPVSHPFRADPEDKERVTQLD